MTHVRRVSRISAWAVACGKIAGTAAIVALGGVLIQPLQAAESFVEACEDAWDDAPAEAYCTDTQIARVGAGTGQGNCVIDVSTCSITVSVEGESITYTPTWPSSYGSSGDGLSVSDTENIDICFASSTSASTGYTATVKSPCDSSDTDSETATDDGLD